MKRTSNYTKFLSVVIGLAMLFTLAVPALAADGYTASFTVEGGDATVNVYFTQDLTTPDETNVSSAVARSSDTGEIDTTGDGQINFVVVPAEGCTATVTATDAKGTTKSFTIMPATSKGRAATAADPGVRINFNNDGTIKNIVAA